MNQCENENELILNGNPTSQAISQHISEAQIVISTQTHDCLVKIFETFVRPSIISNMIRLALSNVRGLMSSSPAKHKSQTTIQTTQSFIHPTSHCCWSTQTRWCWRLQKHRSNAWELKKTMISWRDASPFQVDHWQKSNFNFYELDIFILYTLYTLCFQAKGRWVKQSRFPDHWTLCRSSLLSLCISLEAYHLFLSNTEHWRMLLLPWAQSTLQ